MNQKTYEKAAPISVILPDVLLEGIDNVAAAEFSDRSAIIRSAVKSYLVNYASDDLTEAHRLELKARAAQRDILIPYARVRKELGLINAPNRKKTTRTTRNKRPKAR